MSGAGDRAAVQSYLDDGALVDAIARRVPDALRAAYEQHGSRVHALARGLCGDAAANALTEHVFLELWNEPAGYEAAFGSLRSHLLMQVHRKAVGALRDAEPTAAWLGTLDSTGADALISTLPDEERHAIVLTYFGGHTCSEVARLLRTPQGTIKARIRSGLNRLQSQPDWATDVQPARVTSKAGAR